jgi:hypothetical protein
MRSKIWQTSERYRFVKLSILHNHLPFYRARARELPDHCSFVVTRRLITGSIEQWGDPSRDLLEKVYDVLVKRVNAILDNRFERYQYGGLHYHVK